MSEYVNMVQIPEVTRNQLLEYLKDDDKEAWNIKPMVVGLTDYCEKVLGAPVLEQLIAALGWQGGTIHEALDEVRRLKALETVGAPVAGEKRYWVRNRDGNVLVAGELNGKKYDGQGQAFGFKLSDAKLMADSFDFTYGEI